MAPPRHVPLGSLQPSQLVVSSEKLAAVLAAWPDLDPTSLDALPARRYGDRLVLTDGHTRALAAHRAGLDAVLVIVDEDDLDDEAYEICARWCLAAGIESVADLDARVVSPADYERLWLDRCRALHRELAARRASEPRDP